MRSVSSIVLTVAVLAGCVHPPGKLEGEFAPVTVAEAQRDPRQGIAVRWGGTIVQTTPARDQTCFEVIGWPLDKEARPQPSDRASGRFLACSPGFYEPAVYVPGREITVVGALHGATTRRVGEYDYRFPVVDASTVYLWDVRPAPTPGPGIAPNVGISIGGVFGHW